MRTFSDSTRFRKHSLNFITECEVADCGWFGVTNSYEVYEFGQNFAYDWLHLCPAHNQIFNPKGAKALGRKK